MEFCKICQNMLYMKLAGDGSDGQPDEGDPQLSYYCRKCGAEAGAGAGGTSCAFRVTFKQRDSVSLQPLNAYTKHDATLPVAPETPCPSEGCSVPGSVRYIRYDDTSIKYVYVCTACDATWTVANTPGN
jgi:DNA-directed RNA polymerase subunit M/transcription elongation factor TFIIS